MVIITASFCVKKRCRKIRFLENIFSGNEQQREDDAEQRRLDLQRMQQQQVGMTAPQATAFPPAAQQQAVPQPQQPAAPTQQQKANDVFSSLF